MEWINVNEKYLNYLRKYERRIPRTNYGSDRYKPFFGVLFEKDEFYYITQVFHPQNRHRKMRNQPDFFKVYDPQDLKRLIAVVNLNYMFPIPKYETYKFEKSKIDAYRSFSSELEKNKYIDLLDSEITFINTLNLSESAKILYNNKYEFPSSVVSNRCLDFKLLESYASQWENYKIKNEAAATSEQSD